MCRISTSGVPSLRLNISNFPRFLEADTSNMTEADHQASLFCHFLLRGSGPMMLSRLRFQAVLDPGGALSLYEHDKLMVLEVLHRFDQIPECWRCQVAASHVSNVVDVSVRPYHPMREFTHCLWLCNGPGCAFVGLDGTPPAGDSGLPHIGTLQPEPTVLWKVCLSSYTKLRRFVRRYWLRR